MDHWYEGMDDGWDVGFKATHFDSLMNELVGAGVVGADSEVAAYHGGNTRYYDVVGDGRKCDVKSAWWQEGEHVVGFSGPGKRGFFDPALVDDIVLVLCPRYPAIDFDYRADGTVSMTAVATPDRVWRVPAETINGMMKKHGKSVVRWLVHTSDLEPYLVRSR